MRYIFLLISALMITACSDKATMTEQPVTQESEAKPVMNTQQVSGEIQYITLEGGFFALLGHDGKKYTLSSLPKEFQREGLVINVTGHIDKDRVSFTQFGEFLIVDDITVIDDTNAKPIKNHKNAL